MSLKKDENKKIANAFIDSNEKPSVAVRKGKNSSMGMAIQSVKSGHADAIVSAGNTGALFVISKLNINMIENINSKIWNIKELSQAIKNTIENSFEYVRIRGEISKPSFPSSGHIYFSLKDDSSIINATVWKWTTTNIGIKPEEGLEVICTGKLTTYSGRSSYQINVSKIEHAGEGALLKKLEERKKYFFEKGYFNDEIKKKLPLYPTCVGVITSLQGSVIEDILETFRGRWPCKIIIYSVPVQGLKAAEKISSSIDYFNNLHDPRKKPDLLIIARGGGSVEDLWAFNEEILIEKVFKSKLPIVSAIGHETDTTLIDMVSDIRAPTPTKAAVIVTPNKADILSKIKIININSKEIISLEHDLNFLVYGQGGLLDILYKDKNLWIS